LATSIILVVPRVSFVLLKGVLPVPFFLGASASSSYSTTGFLIPLPMLPLTTGTSSSSSSGASNSSIAAFSCEPLV